MTNTRVLRLALIVAGLLTMTSAAQATEAVPLTRAPQVDPSTPLGATPLASSTAQTLVFSDEFNGTTVDTTKWTKRDWVRGGAVPPDTWRYDPAKVTTDGRGALAIHLGNPAPNEYTGGCIDSKGKFDFTYGTLEARVHIPPTNGHLAAAWVMPTNGFAPGGAYEGTARDGAEMDIVESNFKADKYTVTLHWDGYGPEHRQSSTVAPAPGLHGQWYHTFGLKWTRNRLDFTYDGAVVRTVTDPKLISQVTSYPLLSHEILDAWAEGSIHDEVFDWTSSMYVDYIRIWQ
jgi:beta-glucanase (GH16 family)